MEMTESVAVAAWGRGSGGVVVPLGACACEADAGTMIAMAAIRRKPRK